MAKIKECVECGGKDLRTVRKDMDFERSNPGRIRVESQECVECANCGETYFDERQSEELARKIDRKLKH